MKSYPLSTCLFAVLIGTATHARAADPVTVTFQNGVAGYNGTFDRRIGPERIPAELRVAPVLEPFAES